MGNVSKRQQPDRIICLFDFFFFSHGVFGLFSIYEFDCPSGIFRSSFID